ncbi:LTA synthase family protein [Rossellomorea marisflavi]|uniref:LTA synthase family protein n=1 Tax=Rossellomorea marisflavi TaxID=189381 RepID=A0A5D4RM65_9BACI|nr:LTA synthase family protein [Rossellomorea marisflavi]MDW4528430.1 LTA synthase family protein [Rossellomorea marisflavi]TYS52463.1 LTA synthase family protein [Rossellomorea marisflavi]
MHTLRNPLTYINELLYILLFFKVILFHSFTDTPLSSGVFSTSIGFLLACYGLSFLFSGKWRLAFSGLISLLVSFVFLSNAVYLDYYSSPITLSIFGQMANLGGLGDSITYLFKFRYLLFVVDLVVLPFFLWSTFPYTKKRSMVKGVIPFLTLGLLFLVMKPAKLIFVDRMENPVQAYDSLDHVVQYGLIGHHMLDSYSYVRDRNYKLSDDDRKRIGMVFAAERDPADHPYKTYGKGKNLIMIQVESLQSFVLNEEIGGKEITPTMNRMMKHSLSFPHFYAQTIAGNSSDAEFLTQTALYPLKSGSVFFRYPSNTYHSIGNSLKKDGYSTLGVHADEKTFWNRHLMYPSLGFGDYKTIEQFPQKELVGMGVGDKEMFTETAGILKEQPSPFYSLIVTLTNHMPYDLPVEKQSLSLPKEVNGTLLGDYLQTVRYTDEAIGLFLKELESDGLLEDSIIVLYGDHNGIFERDKSLIEKWKGKSISNEEWYREYATVPFMIYNPGIKGKEIDAYGGQVDVYPTIASIMGTSYTSGLGENLLDSPSGTVVIPSGGYVTKSLMIGKDRIVEGLGAQEQEMLNTSELIIKGDFLHGNE